MMRIPMTVRMIGVAALLAARTAWPCTSGSACQFNMKNATAAGSGWGSLQDGGSITAAATSGTIASLIASGPGLTVDVIWNGAQDTFGGFNTETPVGTNGWRSESALTGSIAAGTWTWKVRVDQDTSFGDDFQICVKVWKSTNANLTSSSGATQIGSRQCSTVSAASGLVTHTASFTTGAATSFSGEYLYVAASWVLPSDLGDGSTVVGTLWVDSANSNIVTPTFTGLPSPPTSVSVTGTTQNSASLSWTAGTGATDYKVFRGTTSGSHPTTVTSSTGNVTSYTDSTALCGTTYFYVLHSVNVAGESGDSNEASGTTLGCTLLFRGLQGVGQ